MNPPVLVTVCKNSNELVHVKRLGSSGLNAENTQDAEPVISHCCAQMTFDKFESRKAALTRCTTYWEGYGDFAQTEKLMEHILMWFREHC